MLLFRRLAAVCRGANMHCLSALAAQAVIVESKSVVIGTMKYPMTASAEVTVLFALDFARIGTGKTAVFVLS